jgi:hypothetical protein
MTQSSTQKETLPAPRGSGLAQLYLSLALTVSAAAVAQESSEYAQPLISPPENWYQVEVILFTQQGDNGNEAPPVDYQLGFPANTQQLIDPRLQNSGITPPIAAGALLSGHKLQALDPLPIIPRAEVEDPAISQFQDQLIELQDTSQELPADAVALAAQRLAEAQALDQQLAEASVYQPRYEQPLLLLDSEFRDLNESALTLDRRGYNVVFHSAWRFASEGQEQDPWLLIQAGQRLDERHQIEGALRFYKSRFLHFETDLWMAQFSNDNSQLIELPELPKTAAPKPDNTQHSSAFYSNLAELQPMDMEPFQGLDNHRSTDVVSLNAAQDLEHLAGPMSPQLLELSTQNSAQPQQYPVAELWTLKKSMRLDEDQVYYIDHPKMGIMLSVKSYQPLLLNPPAVDSDSEISSLVSE